MIKLQKREAQEWYDELLKDVKKYDNGNPDNDYADGFKELRRKMEGLFQNLVRYDDPPPDAEKFMNHVKQRARRTEKAAEYEPLNEQLHVLKHMGNQAAHYNEPPFRATREEYLTGAALLADLVAMFAQGSPETPEALKRELESCPRVELSARETGPQNDQEIEAFVRCILTKVSEIKSKKNGDAYFDLGCEDSGTNPSRDLRNFSLRIWLNTRQDLDYLRGVLAEGQSLHILNMKTLNAKHGHYCATDELLVVVEPDYLFDISDTAYCLGADGADYRTFFLNKLLPASYRKSAFLGLAAGAFFEDYLHAREAGAAPEELLSESFNETVIANALIAANMSGDGLLETYSAMLAEPHLRNMRELAEHELPPDAPLKTEPYYISTRYGLQGRVDLMADRPNGRRLVVELKSGRPPYQAEEIWPAHAAQVVGYEMLLETAADPKPPEGVVFYSKAQPGQALRPTAGCDALHLRRELLRARNTVCAALTRLSEGDAALFDELTAEDFRPQFNGERVGALAAALERGKQNPPLLEWYLESVAFLLRELAYNKVGGVRPDGEPVMGFAALWRDPLEVKQENYSVIAGLRFARFDPLDLLVEMEDESGREHNFRAGDIVILYPAGPRGRPEEQQLLKGALDSIERGRLTLRLYNRQINAGFFDRAERWNLEHDFLETVAWRAVQGLYHFLGKGDAQLFFGGRKPVCRPELPEDLPDSLNDNQREIVSRALRAEDYYLIQGPPGSGKTSGVLTQVVRHKLERTSEIIVVLAFTNRAVERIEESFARSGVPFQRVSSGAFAKEDLNETAPIASARLIREKIKNKRVFVSTIASFLTRVELLRGLVGDLDTLILDEASQITEPLAAGALPFFKRWILIGDHKQLPAVVVQPEGRSRPRAESLASVQLEDFRQSLFERLYRLSEQNGWLEDAAGTLRTHYRMHENIAALLPDCYGAPLVCGKPEQKAPFTFWEGAESKWGELLGKKRGVFVQSGRVVTAKRHPEEAAAVAEIAEAIFRQYQRNGLPFGPETLGVVTPWRAQITEIRARLRQVSGLPEEDVMVDTVERFQGAERDFIIISLAVHDPVQISMMQEEDFEETVDRKLLVALSRAREQVVLIGFDEALQDNRHYGRLIRKFREEAGAFVPRAAYRFHLPA